MTANGECSPLKDSPLLILQEGHILSVAKEAFVLHFLFAWRAPVSSSHTDGTPIVLFRWAALIELFYLFNLTGKIFAFITGMSLVGWTWPLKYLFRAMWLIENFCKAAIEVMATHA